MELKGYENKFNECCEKLCNQTNMTKESCYNIVWGWIKQDYINLTVFKALVEYIDSKGWENVDPERIPVKGEKYIFKDSGDTPQYMTITDIREHKGKYKDGYVIHYHSYWNDEFGHRVLEDFDNRISYRNWKRDISDGYMKKA